jgi:hypothetical protein
MARGGPKVGVVIELETVEDLCDFKEAVEMVVRCATSKS